MMTPMLEAEGFTTDTTTPSNTQRALAFSAVAISMPLLVTVTLLDTEEVCLPKELEIMPRSTGQGSLPLLAEKLVDNAFSDGVRAILSGLAVVPFLVLLAAFLASLAARSLAFLISSAMILSISFWNFFA